MKRIELIHLLFEHNVPIHTWGIGKAKTLEHLVREIESGEAVVENKNGKLQRTAYGAVVNIFYTIGTTIWKLAEDKQVFMNGRVRRRDIDTSIGEKMLPNENPLDAAYRAFEEELGIKEKLDLKYLGEKIKGPIPSISFPGLLSLYYMHAFEVWLPAHLYMPWGYKEIQLDKTTYFTWVKV